MNDLEGSVYKDDMNIVTILTVKAVILLALDSHSKQLCRNLPTSITEETICVTLLMFLFIS